MAIVIMMIIIEVLAKDYYIHAHNFFLKVFIQNNVSLFTIDLKSCQPTPPADSPCYILIKWNNYFFKYDINYVSFTSIMCFKPHTCPSLASSNIQEGMQFLQPFKNFSFASANSL